MRRLRLPRLSNIWALAHYGFPFSVSTPTTPVARLRALGFPARFADKSRAARLLAHAAMTMTWPVGALVDSFRQARVFAAADANVRFVQTWIDMYKLALTRNIPPGEYMLYRLHEPARRADMNHYLYQFDGPALAALNRRRGADNRAVRDKHIFADICAQFGLPHVATLAAFDGGVQVRPNAPFVPGRDRLFVKHLRGHGGLDAAAWLRDGDRYRNAEGETVAVADFATMLRRRDCIVQPLVDNHRDIAPRTNGRLAILRVVTALSGAGEAQFVWTQLTLPSKEHSWQAVGCSLDDAGIVIGAYVGFFPITPVASYPDTGAPLIGFALPFWRESLDLVKRAHVMAFPRFFSLGWDVALTDAGPLLLETNSGWGAMPHQLAEGPIGRTVMSQLLQQELSCA